jgi:hypothetical protein
MRTHSTTCRCSKMARTIVMGAPLSTRARSRPVGAMWVIPLALCLWVAPLQAWWSTGHEILTRAAVLAQPQEVPAFFRNGAEQVAHMSFDPDVAKNLAAPHLYDGESPEHFFNLELLEGADIPDKRHEFIALCRRLDLMPNKVGYAPYSIVETTERLMVAFAEHRKWPQNVMIQAKIFVYAGILAHYAEDIVQPLHATIDSDGRVVDGGEKTHAGIHQTMDSLPGRLEMEPADLSRSVTVAPIESDLAEAVRAQIYESNSRVDLVYELADALDPVSAKGRAMAQERARRAVAFTASLYLTAWQLSEYVRLPGWLSR